MLWLNHKSPSVSVFLLLMLSSVPLSTFITFRSLYTEGFFNAVFQYLHIFHGLRQKVSDSTPSCPLQG